MRRALGFFILFTLLLLAEACQRQTCPTYQTGEEVDKKGRPKKEKVHRSKSGLFPKGF